MPRITISISASGQQLDQELLTLDLPAALTVAELKSFVQAETNLPAQIQHFYFDGHALQSDTQTLEQAGIRDGEMLVLLVNTRSVQEAQQRQTREQSEADRTQPDAARIEAVRARILADPVAISQLIQQQPTLAQVVDDPNKFRDAWIAMRTAQENAQREHENQLALLNQDPLNPESQKKIEEMIRQERIEENRHYAYEHNPAVFTQVTMLYVDVKVNGHPVKAFVDSGAQATIMSPSCAEACNIQYLIDDRFAGTARGVGTAKILGRVHNAKIEIGDAELDCSFTVMEGKDVDLLFGLDMLKRHQACIDLKNNVLTFPHTQVPFLGESEIPKRWGQELMDEPVVQGPNGTEIGAKTGSVRAAGSAAQAARELHNGDQNQPGAGQPNNVTATTAAASQTGPNSTAAGGSSEVRSQLRYSEKDISQLVSMGFSRADAIGALDAAGGNVELAAGLLFDP